MPCHSPFSASANSGWPASRTALHGCAVTLNRLFQVQLNKLLHPCLKGMCLCTDGFWRSVRNGHDFVRTLLCELLGGQAAVRRGFDTNLKVCCEINRSSDHAFLRINSPVRYSSVLCLASRKSLRPMIAS